MNHFDDLIPRMIEELQDNPERPCNLYFQAMEARRLISLALSAGDQRAERAAAAAYGGVVKRWRSWLIEQITEMALSGCDTSRDGVRSWQKRIFGRSISSDRLRQYAQPERSGGGRAAPLAVVEDVERQAAEFYRQHMDAIKRFTE